MEEIHGCCLWSIQPILSLLSQYLANPKFMNWITQSVWERMSLFTTEKLLVKEHFFWNAQDNVHMNKATIKGVLQKCSFLIIRNFSDTLYKAEEYNKVVNGWKKEDDVNFKLGYQPMIWTFEHILIWTLLLLFAWLNDAKFPCFTKNNFLWGKVDLVLCRTHTYLT